MQDFEKLGVFYLGKLQDIQQDQSTDSLLLYDSKDLTTHAVCVGMTGSGKTGLCLSLLEEAAIDGVPAIAIDPKGDLGNLFLTFPQLRAEDFRPWIDENEATRAGKTLDEYAAQVAHRWREGLADWGQQPERIARMRDAVEMNIYTPGSSAGEPLTVLRSFSAPAKQVLEDEDVYRQRIRGAASGLLALLGVSADPVRSREHILLSNVFDHAWREGQDLDIATLIRQIQSPPFQRVGIMDLEQFFPSKDRMELSMTLNNLLASPTFAAWLEGDPVDIKQLLYTKQGKPRLSILSIAHLSETERMFFVTILLNEVLSWIRTQPGTSSLRAILYMDEVFGYFPPTANPPSKQPMLTLLKQARAYGLGIVLATQNPVDLDYKGLANTGTWFLGRLQTERDKLRVLEGLEGASAQAGATFNRREMEATLAGLKKRMFLMNNVHEDEPVVFQTRWAMSYLRGPLTRTQIKTLHQQRNAAGAVTQETEKPEQAAASRQSGSSAPQKILPSSQAASLPAVPSTIEQLFLSSTERVGREEKLVYRPAILGRAKLHFVRATYQVDLWQERFYLEHLAQELPEDAWEEAERIDLQKIDWEERADGQATFAPLPAPLASEKTFTSWQKELKNFLYRTELFPTWRCNKPKEYADQEEDEADFRARITQLAREERDLKLEKLRDKYASKLTTLRQRIQAAESRLEKEKSQYRKATFDSMMSFGASIFGALMGRKLASRTNINKATSSMRSVGRAAQQRGDIAPAEEKLETLEEQLREMEIQFEEDTAALEAAYQPEALDIEQLDIRPRKSDIAIEPIALVWTPWRVDSAGIAERLFDLGLS